MPDTRLDPARIVCGVLQRGLPLNRDELGSKVLIVPLVDGPMPMTATNPRDMANERCALHDIGPDRVAALLEAASLVSGRLHAVAVCIDCAPKAWAAVASAFD